MPSTNCCSLRVVSLQEEARNEVESVVCFLPYAVSLAAPSAVARDAAFLEPGTGGASASDEAVKVDPKAEIDIGDTTLNVAKRTSIFFRQSKQCSGKG